VQAVWTPLASEGTCAWDPHSHLGRCRARGPGCMPLAACGKGANSLVLYCSEHGCLTVRSECCSIEVAEPLGSLQGRQQSSQSINPGCRGDGLQAQHARGRLPPLSAPMLPPPLISTSSSRWGHGQGLQTPLQVSIGCVPACQEPCKRAAMPMHSCMRCMHARTHARMHARRHARRHARTHACTCTRAHMYTCMHARMHACKYSRTHARTHARMHMHTLTHAHVYTCPCTHIQCLSSSVARSRRTRSPSTVCGRPHQPPQLLCMRTCMMEEGVWG